MTNVPTAATSRLLYEPMNPFGGWLEGSLSALQRETDVDVVVGSPCGDDVRMLGTADGTEYLTFPAVVRRQANDRGREIAAEVIRTSRPDIVHIHGTELSHALSFASVANDLSLPTLVSIQGLVSVYARHMTAFLPWSVVYGIGSRPWVRSDRVAGLRRSFEVQGRLEHETLRSVPYVIGRTAWDRACTAEINPRRRYHHCDETLRSSFYTAAWRLDDVRPHSIFVGQGHYPIKGLHLLLAAMPAVLSRFPDCVVTVAGYSPIAGGRRAPYARHVAGLIHDLGLAAHVRFVGLQTEEEMLAQYLRSNLVVCPSVVENSPNSIAEAMLLGAPVVAARVGGIPDILGHGSEGLTYQSDAPNMLADSIITIFENPERATEMGVRARRRAQHRHDPRRNARRTMEIYTEVVSEEKTR